MIEGLQPPSATGGGPVDRSWWVPAVPGVFRDCFALTTYRIPIGNKALPTGHIQIGAFSMVRVLD